MAKNRKLEVRLTEYDYQLIMRILKPKYEKISVLIRNFLKEKIREEINNDKELEKIEEEIKQNMYEDFLKDE